MFRKVTDAELLAFAKEKCPEVEITVFDGGLRCHGNYYLNWSLEGGRFYANHPKFDMSQPEPKMMPGAICSRLGVKNAKLIAGSGRYSGEPVCVIEKSDLRSAFLKARDSSVKGEQTLSDSSSPKSNKNNGLKLIAAIIGSPAIAAQYALNKTWKSLRNLYRTVTQCKSYKPWRSLFRLGATAVGGMEGAKYGMMLGALIGSIFPGAGTLIGTIIGGIIGGCLGAGLGALLAKKITHAALWARKYFVACSNDDPYLYFRADKLDRPVNDRNIDKYPLTNDPLKHSTFQKLYDNKREAQQELSTWARISSWLASKKDKKILEYNKNLSIATDKVRKGDWTYQDEGVLELQGCSRTRHNAKCEIAVNPSTLFTVSVQDGEAACVTPSAHQILYPFRSGSSV